MFFFFGKFISQIESEVWFLEKRPKNWTISRKALLGLGFSCPVFFREIGQTGHAPRKALPSKDPRFLTNWTFLDMCPVFGIRRIVTPRSAFSRPRKLHET
jgi:hypothetical protein